MNKQEIYNVIKEQEREINNIFIDSSLYLGMSQTDRQKLLYYLVASYFYLLTGESSRALPKAIQFGPAM
jgi:hypothetical protein